MAKKFIDYTINGVKVPGVTTVLGAALAKPELMWWYLKMGKEGKNPKEILKEASEIGDAVHKTLDCVIRGQNVKVSGVMENIVHNFSRTIENWTWVGGEFRVYNEKHMYAGTIDQCFVIDGKPTLVDIKTSNNVYPEMTLQLAAYIMGKPINDPEYLEIWSRIEKALIIHIDKATGAVEVLDRTPQKIDKEAFLHARYLYDWVKLQRG